MASPARISNSTDLREKLLEIAKTMTFTERGHRFDVNGERWPSVTQILSLLDRPAITNWRVNEERKACQEVARQIHLGNIRPPEGQFDAYFEAALGKEKAAERQSREARDLGKELHSLIQWWIATKLRRGEIEQPKTSEKAVELFGTFLAWADDVGLKPLASEAPIYALTAKYAGQLDMLALVRKKLKLVDFKTSKETVKKAWPEWEMQTVGAYAPALREHGIVVDGVSILVLPKNGDPVTELPLEMNESAESKFRCLVSYWWYSRS